MVDGELTVGNIMDNTGDPKGSQPQPPTDGQAISGRSTIRVNPIGKSNSAPAVIRIEAKRRYPWVRDHTNPPTTVDHSAWEADRRVLPNGPKVTVSGSGAAGRDHEKKQNKNQLRKETDQQWP